MNELKPSEVLYAFCAWLSTQDEILKIGASCDCAIWAEKIKQFCDDNNLESPEEGWYKKIKATDR